jgi:hypothetical protein
MRNTYKILVGKPEGKRRFENLGVGGKLILEWILGKLEGKVCTGIIWLTIGTSDGFLRTGNEPLGSIKGREYVDWESDCKLLKKDYEQVTSLIRRGSKIFIK